MHIGTSIQTIGAQGMSRHAVDRWYFSMPWYLNSVVVRFTIYAMTMFFFLLLVLENAFVKNFADVNVNVVDCPDLTQPPFSLAASGEYPTVNFVLLFRSLIVDVIHYS